MAFSRSWNENDPDGDVITISQLDDASRDIKVAVRERLEGDSNDPYSGIFESGSFQNTARVRMGTARAHVALDANVPGLPKLDGAMALSSDKKRLYHLATAGISEIEYLNRDGSRAATGDIDLGTHNVKNLKAGTVPGHAVEYSQAAIVNGQRTISGNWTFNRGAGLAPFSVSDSVNVVLNLDADKLDGHHASDFMLAGAIDNSVKFQAKKLDSSMSAGTSYVTISSLNLPLGAGESWVIKYALNIITSNSYQVQLLGVNTVIMLWEKEGFSGADSSAFSLTGNGQDQILYISAVVSMPAGGAGTSFLQVRSVSGTSTVASGSHCMAMRIG